MAKFLGLGGGPSPQAPPPVPVINQAQADRTAQDSVLMRGRATTILTSQNGLPNLGSTTSAAAKAG